MRINGSKLGLVCACAFILLLAGNLFAQTMTTADLTGVVTDATGAVVPGATVTVKSVDTNETRTATTNTQGQYRFPLMKPGDYTISSQSSGLVSSTERFTLGLSAEQAVNLVMKVQQTQQTVEVSAEAAPIQTENANLTTSFATRQVLNLPFNGGDLTTVSMTIPGVLMGGAVSGSSGDSNVVINGINGGSVLYTLNGADDMDPYLNINNSGASNNLLGQNEIAEASVITNAYSAQFGRMMGGQVNYVSKGGTNAFHGNLSYQYNSDGLNANDFFFNEEGVPKSKSVANYPAASLGGPILKNKLFFYTNFESLRYLVPTGFDVSIPSPQLQSYILTQIPAASVPFYQKAFGLWNAAPGISRALPVTTGTGPLQDASGNLGCGSNGTLKGTHGPNGEIFGVNTSCALSFGEAATEYNAESLVTVKSDYNINDKQKVSFRYNYDWGIQATGPSAISSVFNSQSTQPSDQGQLNYTYILTPTLVNNFIGSGSWYTAIFGVASFSAAQSALPEILSFTDPTINGNATTGFTRIGAGLPNGRNVGQGQFVDDLSWTKGTHHITFGVNYRFDKITDTSIASGTQEGTYTIADNTDFAIGVVDSTKMNSSFSQSYTHLLAAHIRMYSMGFYAQDEWAVKKNLKFTFGLRFERDGDPECLDNCFARFNAPFGTSAFASGVTVPYNASIESGLSQEFASLEPLIPEPRFGFAWSPFASNKTVIRGGIGLFANLFSGSTATTFFDQAPAKTSPQVLFGNIGLASDPTSAPFAAQAAASAFFTGFGAGDTLGQLQAALGKIPFSPFNYTQYPNDFQVPKEIEWSFEVQQQLNVRDVLAVTYTGNHGYNLFVGNQDANAFINTKDYPNGFPYLTTTEPDARFNSVTEGYTTGLQNYDAMTVQFRHSFWQGLQGQFGYTWSHDLGDQTNGTSTNLYNPFNLAANYGNLPIDRRHAFTGDLVYQEPFRSSNVFLNAILGGWNLGYKVFLYSGRPFTATDSKIDARLSATTGNTFLADVITPGLVGTSCGLAALSTQCVTASEFASSTAQDDFGNVAPGEFRGPWYFDMDTQLLKGFRVKERFNFQVGGQFYNLLNHFNPANPSGSVTSGALGLITADVSEPTSIYGTGQGAFVSGRVIVLTGKFVF
jgi:Carboxypeptidase regulatory-like domain